MLKIIGNYSIIHPFSTLKPTDLSEIHHMQDVLTAGKASFSIDVPYKLIETGAKGEKPLILYLHGFNQNIEYFEKKMEDLKSLKAYHLFIQGPYPIYNRRGNKEVSQWGRSWYLYDGNQEQFLKSMEAASKFIEGLLYDLKQKISVSRLGIFGYSMGGYLGGYFAFSRGQLVNDLVVVGGRIKTEVFEGKLQQANHLKILALHGKDDTSVYPEPQKECIGLLKDKGFDAEFRLVEAEHKLTSIYITKTYKWLQQIGYIES